MSMMYDDGLHEQVMGHMEQDLGPEMKQQRESVNYRESPSQDQSCLVCVNFLAGDNQCRVIGGEVSAAAVCDEFVATETDGNDDGRAV